MFAQTTLILYHTEAFLKQKLAALYTTFYLRLFPPDGFKGYVLFAAEIFFMVSTFYYIINLLAVLKKDGRTEFCNNKWNLADCLTVVLSLLAIGTAYQNRFKCNRWF